jgi:flagellin
MSSNITLTAGIRQNLLSLQQTSAELTSTQQALATGNKVNSAAENPSAYFTSQNLTNTANSLSALLDQIGQGQQTIDAATNGLTSLTSLLQQALSTAQQAQQAASGTISYSTITGTQTINPDSTQAIGSTAVSSAVTASGVTASTQANVVLTSAGIAALNTGHVLTFQLGSGSAVTATFGTTNNATTFDDAAGLQTILNTAFTAGTPAATATTDGSGDLTLTSDDLANNFTVAGNGTADIGGGGLTVSAYTKGSALTISNGTDTATFYYVAGNASAANGTFTTATDLANAITNAASSVHGTIGATNDSGKLELTSSTDGITVGGALGSPLGFSGSTYDDNYNSTLSGFTANSTLTVQVGSNATQTITFGTGQNQVSTLAELNAQLTSLSGITATVDGSGNLQFTPTSTDPVTIGGTTSTLASLGLTAGSVTPQATVETANSTRSTLQENYNGLLTQINQLAGDSSYNGVNLLAGDNLVVDFNPSGSSSLTITGVNFNSAGLGLDALSGSQFQDNNQINTVVSALNDAITQVQTQTETFGTNSGVINTRQTFETNMINTLQTGASSLVAADQNEESADLLTEQTQQQLEISALSIANQANQSVLKLFG